MNNSTKDACSRSKQVQESEENISMFFDFDAPVQDSSRSGQEFSTDQSGIPQRTAMRVSLACVPCRSRHVKCGAETPSCIRCQQDGRPCFYAKSRRGMRDRNIPRKRASMREADQEGLKSSCPNGTGFRPTHPPMCSWNDLYDGPCSEGSLSPDSSPSRPSRSPESESRLIDLYYSCFHKAHPFLLPRYYFLSRLESDPESLKHVLPVVKYIGSLFAPDISSDELREAVVRQLELSDAPPNGFTVQTLLLMTITVYGEGNLDQSRAILDRAIFLALEIQMNSRVFANMERDPVMGESWRRTYWFLYISDTCFAARERTPNFSLNFVETTVELPCEECDYDGIIPRPRTLDEYEARDFEDETPVFSSFTYLIDLTRMVGPLLALERTPSKDMESAVGKLDNMLVNWKLHLPREKQDVVDKNEEVDEILFQAHNLLHIWLVHIHRPLSRLHHSAIEATSQCSPPPIPHQATGDEDRTYWLHTKKALDAAGAAIDQYALPCLIKHHSPVYICGVAKMTLANLSACANILEGAEWLRTRDRIRLGLGTLKAYGEVWPLAQRTEKELKNIARQVFAKPRPENVIPSSTVNENVYAATSQDTLVKNFFEMGWPDQLDYLASPQDLGSVGT